MAGGRGATPPRHVPNDLVVEVEHRAGQVRHVLVLGLVVLVVLNAVPIAATRAGAQGSKIKRLRCARQAC